MVERARARFPPAFARFHGCLNTRRARTILVAKSTAWQWLLPSLLYVLVDDSSLCDRITSCTFVRVKEISALRYRHDPIKNVRSVERFLSFERAQRLFVFIIPLEHKMELTPVLPVQKITLAVHQQQFLADIKYMIFV